LIGITHHFGGIGGGHYTANAKHENKWYYFDDEMFNEVKKPEINKSAYVLIYKMN